MKRRLIFAMLVMGFSGLAAQIVLLRELLITFYGNELSIGIILANWLILEAMGSLFLGKSIERFNKKIAAFVVVSLVFSVCLPLMVFLARILKEIIGVSAGEGIGVVPILYSSFLILLPVSVTHGALFTYGCKICSLYTAEDATIIGKVYIYETLGTIAAGIILTYFLIPHISSLHIVFLVALLNGAVCAVLLGPFWRRAHAPSIKIVGGACALLLLFGGAVMLSGAVGELHSYSIDRQWKGQKVVHYENSIYGNVAVIEREDEFTFFSSGVPLFTAPNPDIVFVEEFAHFTLLAHPQPRDILVISGGVGGLIHEILKHPVENIDYVELDPLILDVARKFPTPLTQAELDSPAVTIVFDDGRLFTRRRVGAYDAVLVGLSNPQDLHTNRFFTKEFFEVVKRALKEGGVLALSLPGSLTYLSEEVKNLNACILGTLKSVFPFVRVIPGDGTNLYLSSTSEEAYRIGPAGLARRLEQRGINTYLISQGYMEYRLGARWRDWFFSSVEGAAPRINRDFQPIGVFYSLTYWNALFSPQMRGLFRSFEKVTLPAIAIPIVLFTAVFLLIGAKRSSFRRAGVPLAIATTGFAGMLFDLVLIFMFQALYGYVFYWIGLLITAFMAGTATGA